MIKASLLNKIEKNLTKHSQGIMTYQTSFEVTPHPPTIFISSGLSMLSALLILYLYIVHKHLRTLFFNTFAALVSLGAFQFLVLVIPFTCFWEGFFMYYILTFNNCITAFIIWLLYAFVRYGKRTDPCIHLNGLDTSQHLELDTIDDQIANISTGNINIEQIKVPSMTPIQSTKSDITLTPTTKMGLGNHLSRQLSFKKKLGDIQFELSTLQKIFWFSFVLLIPIVVTIVGFFEDFYGPWTV